jgi:hypothetical protein
VSAKSPKDYRNGRGPLPSNSSVQSRPFPVRL